MSIAKAKLGKVNLFVNNDFQPKERRAEVNERYFVTGKIVLYDNVIHNFVQLLETAFPDVHLYAAYVICIRRKQLNFLLYWKSEESFRVGRSTKS